MTQVLTVAYLLLGPFIKRLVGGSSLCWPASLCGGRPFMHVLSHMSADWLLCSSSYSSVVAIPLSCSSLSISAKVRGDINGHVCSEIVVERNCCLNFFSYTPSCIKKILCGKIIGLFLDMKVTQVTAYTF